MSDPQSAPDQPNSQTLPISPAGADLERAKYREQWLRTEIQTVRALTFTLIQWGVTVLVAVQTSLYYLRRDIATHLIDGGTLHKGDIIPWPRWFAGTLFLVFLAVVFSGLVRYLTEKLISYRKQLIAMNPSYSGIIEVQPPTTGWTSVTYMLFYVFPLIDQIFYLAFSYTTSIQIPW